MHGHAGGELAARERNRIKTLLPLLSGRIEVLYGVGSAEGLARVLSDKRHVLLAFDEMKSLFDKCKLDGSSLLAMIASFFEGNRWSNPTKNPKQSSSSPIISRP